MHKVSAHTLRTMLGCAHPPECHEELNMRSVCVPMCVHHVCTLGTPASAILVATPNKTCLKHTVCALFAPWPKPFSWGGIRASIPQHIPSDTTLCSLNRGALCEFPNPSFPCHRPDLPACTPMLCHSQKQRATTTSKNRLLQQWARRHHCVMLSVRDSSPHSVQVRPYKIQRRQHR